MQESIAKLLLPSRTCYGPGSRNELPGLISPFNAKAVCVLTDKEVSKAGLVSPVVGLLQESSYKVTVFDDTTTEPNVECIDEAIEAMADRPDLLVSIGGGSVMDTAKCANIVRMNGGSILDYEDGVEGERRHVKMLMPHVCIPTTAGTGSEATVWAMYIDPSRKFKTGVQDPRLLADVVILDPDMTRSMPAKVAASTGMDALTHAIEAFVSQMANPFTDALSIQAIKLVSRSLRDAVNDRGDVGARMDMLLASFMGGAAFTNSSLGIVHTLAETLGGYYRIPHGVTNALMLPHVMEFNRSANPAKFAEIAWAMDSRTAGLSDEKASGMAVDAVSELSKSVGLPRRLREAGVKRDDLQELTRMAFKWANVSGNPREVSEGEVMSLYERAY